MKTWLNFLFGENLIARLKARWFKPKAKQSKISYYDKKILIAARNYSMMVNMGCYVEKNSSGQNSVISVSQNDRDRYAEIFLSNLKFAARDSMVEDSVDSHPEVKFYG